MSTNNAVPHPQKPGGLGGVARFKRWFILISYFFDSVGYLSDSGLLSDFFALSSVAACIAICRKIFVKGV